MEICNEVCSLDKYGLFLQTLTMLAALTTAGAAVSAYTGWISQRNAKVAEDAFNALFDTRRLYEKIQMFKPFMKTNDFDVAVATSIQGFIDQEKASIETLNLSIHKLYALTNDKEMAECLTAIAESISIVGQLCLQIETLHNGLLFKTTEDRRLAREKSLNEAKAQLVQFISDELSADFYRAYDVSFDLLKKHMGG